MSPVAFCSTVHNRAGLISAKVRHSTVAHTSFRFHISVVLAALPDSEAALCYGSQKGIRTRMPAAQIRYTGDAPIKSAVPQVVQQALVLRIGTQ